jgi:VWFA-related protein
VPSPSTACRRSFHCARWRAVLCAFLLLAATPSAAQQLSEALDVNVVGIDVQVHDAQGRPIGDLVRDDFTVLEDGKRVSLLYFTAVRPERAVFGATPGASGAGDVPDVAADPTAHAPARIAVVIDNQRLRPTTRARALEQLQASFGRSLATGVPVMVATLDPALTIRLPFSTDPAAVGSALAALGALPASGTSTASDRATAIATIFSLQKDNVTLGEPCAPNLLDPIRAFAGPQRADVIATLARLRFLAGSFAGLPGRTALVYVSDGLPQQPGQELFALLEHMCGGGAAAGGLAGSDEMPFFDARSIPGAYQAHQAGLDSLQYAVTDELHRLAAHANANRVSFYTVQATGLTVSNLADASGEMGNEGRLLQAPGIASILEENPKGPLVYLAHETGGRAVVDTNDFVGGLAPLRDDLATYYSIGFSNARQADGRQHRIEVRVSRPGARLIYRRSYRDKLPAEVTVDRLLAALLHGLEDNPLDATIEVGAPAPLAGGRFRVTTRLLVPLFRLGMVTHGEVHEGKLRFFVVTAEGSRAISAVRQVEIPLRVPRLEAMTAFGQSYAHELHLDLSSGEHVLAFALRDETAGIASYLRRTVSVGAEPAEPAAPEARVEPAAATPPH